MTASSFPTAPTAGQSRLKRAAPWLVAMAILSIMPFVFANASSVTIMSQMAITIVFALSYNMLLGQTGLLSFGHAVFMGMGGFFSLHLLNWIADGSFYLPLPLLPLAGGVFGFVCAALLGFVATVQAGTAFAMITLGIGSLVAAISVILVTFFGGEQGIGANRTYAAFAGIEFLTQREVYFIICGWMLVSAFAMFQFTRTPMGNMANAIRDNAERAEFLGYSARWVRFWSYALSGFFAGIAGALFAINYEIMTSESFSLAASGTILLVTFLGGVGYFFGPVLGAIVFTLLQTVLSRHSELWQLYLGLLFLFTVVYLPHGLAGLLAMHAMAWRRGRVAGLFVPYAKSLLPAGIAVMAGASAIELVHRLKSAELGQTTYVIFGVRFDVYNPMAWVGLLVVLLLAIWLAVRNAPAVRAAWHEANAVESK